MLKGGKGREGSASQLSGKRRGSPAAAGCIGWWRWYVLRAVLCCTGWDGIDGDSSLGDLDLLSGDYWGSAWDDWDCSNVCLSLDGDYLYLHLYLS